MTIQAYTTLNEDGRVHFAANLHWQGSVYAYNCCITKLFTKMFGISMDVEVQGVTRCLNKESYLALLNKLKVKDVTLINLHQFKTFDLSKCEVIKSEGFMREKLGSKKVDRLSIKLMAAIQNNDLTLASEFLAKGADVNRFYWIRGYDKNISSYRRSAIDLPKIDLRFDSFHLNPLLFSIKNREEALKMNNEGLANRLAYFIQTLFDFGAKNKPEGQKVTFNRNLKVQSVDLGYRLTTDYPRSSMGWVHSYARYTDITDSELSYKITVADDLQSLKIDTQPQENPVKRHVEKRLFESKSF